MDKLLQLESPLFHNDVASIHKKVIERIRALEESSFNWMDEILEDARSVFNQSDNICLLPKTPSAKRKGRAKRKSTQSARRKIQVEEDEDDYVPTQENKKSRASKQANKRVQEDLSSDEDFEGEPSSKVSKIESSPVGRKTRATSRAATTSRARNTRKAKNSRKNKSKSQEPVLNLEQLARNEAEELLQTPKQTQLKKSVDKDASVCEEVTETWIQSATKTIKRPSNLNVPSKSVTDTKSKDSLDGTDETDKEPHNETIHEIQETWVQPASENIKAPGASDKVAPKVTNAKTPIQNFNSMNVKEKVHAYEEIILISPMTCKKRTISVSPMNNVSSKTPPKVDMSPKTPPNVAISKKTPDTVVNVSNTRNSTGSESPELMEDEPDTPVRKENKSSKKNKDKRLSKRVSVSKSLTMLPSALKMQALHSEPETKPTRARTRLRLKKKEQPTESEQETTTDDQTETDSQDEEIVKPSSPSSKTRRTRSLTRNEETGRQTSRKSSQMEESSESENNTEPEEVMCTPKVVRSTRTKTRHAQHQAIVTEVDKVSSKDSGVGGSSSSIDGDGTPRVTRSKIRKPKEPMEVTDSVMPSPAVTRVTRTKTRKRQHEEEPESEQRKPKRSCTSNSSVDMGHSKTSGDEQSSDDEVNSPVCPPNKVVRPVPSFLNSLNKNSNNPIRPANLQTGGLVKSFLVRNSPAPKPTLSEIQTKRKQELLEKERKERERLKRREEEQSKKMEEMRKKREEKMKKVQEMREQRQRQEKENRMQIERRLMEKRQQTQKLREEKIKEEKEKQKMRLQKMEEAEERRKQDEEERQKKLQEQLEQEKFHEEMLQRKKEFEEQERQQKIEEEKRRAAERQQENEREREKEKLRLLKIEEEKKKEWQKKKEEKEKLAAQERAEKEKLELEKKKEREIQMKKEMERIREQERIRLAEQERIKAQQRKQDEEIKKMVHKHNTQVQQSKLPKPNMNKTHSLEEASVQQNTSNDSYEMTPKRVPMASTTENYGIDDLNSGDETDDDECPRKRIPDWAQGSQLKTLLIKQHYHPPNLDELFDVIEAPDLNVLFEKKKARFNKRTSSAHWDSPILKPGLLGRV